MSHSDAVANKYEEPLSKEITTLITEHYSKLPERPDYDGVLTKREADQWWWESSGAPLYVDQSKIDLPGITTRSFSRTSENVLYKNFIWGLSETGIPDSPYVVDVIEAYRYNKENWQQAGFEGESPIVELVERKDIRVSIFTEIGQDSEYFRDNGGIPFIRWNSSEGLETDSGVVLSPASILAHEADHAIDDLTNANAHSDRKRTLDSQYENAEERRVITGSEQKTAFANGEIRKRQVTRQNHDGHTVYTYGATSNTIDRFTTDYYYRRIKKSDTK